MSAQHVAFVEYVAYRTSVDILWMRVSPTNTVIWLALSQQPITAQHSSLCRIASTTVDNTQMCQPTFFLLFSPSLRHSPFIRCVTCRRACSIPSHWDCLSHECVALMCPYCSLGCMCASCLLSYLLFVHVTVIVTTDSIRELGLLYYFLFFACHVENV